MKPILFNTEMVRAIMNKDKDTTRRNIKNAEILIHDNYVNIYGLDRSGNRRENDVCGFPYTTQEKISEYMCKVYAPYKVGDILYVRETWLQLDDDYKVVSGKLDKDNMGKNIIFKADKESEKRVAEIKAKWRPSIHMPQKVAKRFSRVTSIKCERLLEITEEKAIAEGCPGVKFDNNEKKYPDINCFNVRWIIPPQSQFLELWNSTISKADYDRYGWEANPWVWVLGFEPISKEEAYNLDKAA